MEKTLLSQIQAGQSFIVNARRRNGVILCKPYHAEFAGPGALIGGSLDLTCQKLVGVGKLSILLPASPDDLHRACLIRRQWILLTQKMTAHDDSQERARLLLTQFDNYFRGDDLASLSDELLGQLVGTFCSTIVYARLGLEA
ncbi:MAG: hypothetical protein ACO4CG_11965 [Prochlorothrix sp.]|nr:hypothetical protein [Prochlorothrix sp.]